MCQIIAIHCSRFAIIAAQRRAALSEPGSAQYSQFYDHGGMLMPTRYGFAVSSGEITASKLALRALQHSPDNPAETVGKLVSYLSPFVACYSASDVRNHLVMAVENRSVNGGPEGICSALYLGNDFKTKKEWLLGWTPSGEEPTISVMAAPRLHGEPIGDLLRGRLGAAIARPGATFEDHVRAVAAHFAAAAELDDYISREMDIGALIRLPEGVRGLRESTVDPDRRCIRICIENIAAARLAVMPDAECFTCWSPAKEPPPFPNSPAEKWWFGEMLGNAFPMEELQHFGIVPAV